MQKPVSCLSFRMRKTLASLQPPKKSFCFHQLRQRNTGEDKDGMENKYIYIARYPGKPYPSFNRKGLTNVYTGVANHQLQILEGCLLHASHGETDLMNVHVGVANPQLQILEGCLLHASRGEGTQPAETLNSLVSTRHLVCRRSS